MSDFKDQLFTCAGLSGDNIVEFSCGKSIVNEFSLEYNIVPFGIEAKL